jgi:hypothetical protein
MDGPDDPGSTSLPGGRPLSSWVQFPQMVTEEFVSVIERMKGVLIIVHVVLVVLEPL